MIVRLTGPEAEYAWSLALGETDPEVVELAEALMAKLEAAGIQGQNPGFRVPESREAAQ